MNSATSGQGLDGIAGWATDLMERLGAVGAGLAIALENLFPPLPSEVILPLAGFTAAQGKMSLAAALIWTTLGSVVGALALYGIGAAIGRDRIRALVTRLPLVKIQDLDRTEAWFARHGAKAVFFGRMIPIFRSLISVPAGVERMRMTTFLLYTTLGSALWNTAFVLAGYGLGDNWSRVEQYVGVYSKGVLAVVALAGAIFLATRIIRNRRSRNEPEPAAPSADPKPEPGLTGAARTAPFGYGEGTGRGGAAVPHAASRGTGRSASGHHAERAPAETCSEAIAVYEREAARTYGPPTSDRRPSAGGEHDTTPPANDWNGEPANRWR